MYNFRNTNYTMVITNVLHIANISNYDILNSIVTKWLQSLLNSVGK
jgi:hypothetical protein